MLENTSSKTTITPEHKRRINDAHDQSIAKYFKDLNDFQRKLATYVCTVLNEVSEYDQQAVDAALLLYADVYKVIVQCIAEHKVKQKNTPEHN